MDNICLKHRVTNISFAYEGGVQLNIGDSCYEKLYKEVIGNLEHGVRVFSQACLRVEGCWQHVFSTVVPCILHMRMYTHTYTHSMCQSEACRASGFGFRMNSLKNVGVRMEGKKVIHCKVLS